MANAYTVTLVKGPISVDVQGYRFTQNRAVAVTDEALALRLKGDSNFVVVAPVEAKPTKAVVPVAAKKEQPEPEQEPEAVDEEEEGEEDDESDLDEEEEGEEEGEEEEDDKLLTREELKGLKKSDLLEIAKTSSVKVAPEASKNEIIDTILEALGEDG